jgi:hypothetical protein
VNTSTASAVIQPGMNWRPDHAGARLDPVRRQLTVASLPRPRPSHPARLHGAPELIASLFTVALADVEANQVQLNGQTFFGAGKTFGPMMYERDISYSGVLALNRLYPDIMLQSLRYTRRLRLKLGFTVSRQCDLRPLGIDCTVLDCSEQQFMQTHFTNSYSRRTDDPVWLWSVDDLLQHQPQFIPEHLPWAYQTGEQFFAEFYAPFFDPADGLYRGQATFIDAHYADDDPATAYPLGWSMQDCIRIKAASTNCLYYRAMLAMKRFATLLGRDDQARQWAARADSLAQSIRRHLTRPDGSLTYFKHVDGTLEPRGEALGAALAVLFGVVKPANAHAVLKPFTMTDHGVPLLVPFLDRPEFYHNRSSWPFVDRFVLWAKQVATGQSTGLEAVHAVARSCTESGTFYEVVDFATGCPTGSRQTLWTASSFLGAVLEAAPTQGWTLRPAPAA